MEVVKWLVAGAVLVVANLGGLIILIMDGDPGPGAGALAYHAVIIGWFLLGGAILGGLVPRAWGLGALAGVVGIALAPQLLSVGRGVEAGYEVIRTVGAAAAGAYFGARLRG